MLECNVQEFNGRDITAPDGPDHTAWTSRRLRVADFARDHHLLSFLLSSSTKQNIKPLLVEEIAPCVHYDLAIEEVLRPKLKSYPVTQLRTKGPHQLHTLMGWDNNKNYFMKLQVESYTLYATKPRSEIVNDEKRKEKMSDQALDDLRNEFLFPPCSRCKPGVFMDCDRDNCLHGRGILMLYITRLLPKHILPDHDRRNCYWFPALAKVLMETKVTISVARQEGPGFYDARRIPKSQRFRMKRADTPKRFNPSTSDTHLFIHRGSIGPDDWKEFLYGFLTNKTTFTCTAHVNGLTALLLTMAAHGDLPAIARVFFFAPSQIAQEIRVFNLAPVVGVDATVYLISCIFNALKKHDYDINQPDLLLAATHLLVSHMGRNDYHDSLRQAIPGYQDYVAERLCTLVHFKRKEAPDPTTDFETYAKVAALRHGIVYGAMRAYAHDVDAHNMASVEALKVFAAAATNMASSAVRFAPVGGAASGVVNATGTWISWVLDRLLNARWCKDELEKALAARFDLEITAPVRRGRMPLLDRNGLENQDAGIIVEEVRKRQEVLDAYLEDVRIVAEFAVNGGVTSRLSTLRRKRFRH